MLTQQSYHVLTDVAVSLYKEAIDDICLRGLDSERCTHMNLSGLISQAIFSFIDIPAETLSTALTYRVQ